MEMEKQDQWDCLKNWNTFTSTGIAQDKTKMKYN